MWALSLLVRPAPGELDPVALGVADQVEVEKLAAVVGVDPTQLERQAHAHLLECGDHSFLALAEHSSSHGPCGMDVRDIQGEDRLGFRSFAGVRHQVDLGEPWDRDVPSIRLDGNLVLQEGPRLGAAVHPVPELRLLRLQTAIDLARADLQELALRGPAQGKALPEPRQPHGEHHLQSNRPGIPSCLPDDHQSPNHIGSVMGSPRPTRPWTGRRAWPAEQPDRVLPVVAANPAELIQDRSFRLRRSPPISVVNRPQVLSPSHSRHLPPSPEEGYLLDDSTIHPSVTSWTA